MANIKQTQLRTKLKNGAELTTKNELLLFEASYFVTLTCIQVNMGLLNQNYLDKIFFTKILQNSSVPEVINMALD